jgi:hypothetical protein
MALFRRKKDGLSREAIESLAVEVRTRIEGLQITPRSPNDDGPRVAVMGLRGAFVFSRDEAERRIRAEWPDLDDDHVGSAVKYLAARVRASAEPVKPLRRMGYVQSWREG